MKSWETLAKEFCEECECEKNCDETVLVCHQCDEFEEKVKNKLED